ncbi:MAG: hypothetical protein D3923_04620, partial [Candidatus Electrothrix sp. AR3]|nr:hypothetical protein [Candidatus Electrothrix sp. AR3]
NDLCAAGWSCGSNDVDDTVWSYQLSTGIGYALNEQLTVDALYRYFATDDPEFDGNVNYEFASHNFLVGLRFTL